MDNFRSLANRLNVKVDILESKNKRLENEIKMLKEQHHAEIQEWQRACSMLEDEILEMQEFEQREVA